MSKDIYKNALKELVIDIERHNRFVESYFSKDNSRELKTNMFSFSPAMICWAKKILEIKPKGVKK